jgi:hypothetical protein
MVYTKTIDYSQKSLSPDILSEIQRIVSDYQYERGVLLDFASFVVQKNQTDAKRNKKQKLSINEIKKKIYEYFEVTDTDALKKSGLFQLSVSGMENINLSKKETWEQLYRKFIGILPGEENETGYGCINGINIFKYNRPWQVFDLDPNKATTEDIKSAYRKLSKIYHPDIPETGNQEIFERLTNFYKSLTETLNFRI